MKSDLRMLTLRAVVASKVHQACDTENPENSGIGRRDHEGAGVPR